MFASTLFDTFLTQRWSFGLCLAIRNSLTFLVAAEFTPGEAPHECDLARLFMSFPFHLFEPIPRHTKAQNEQVLQRIRAQSCASH